MATGPLGPNGSPIRTSSYAIDLNAGPIMTSTRATGLGGAYVAIAEGVEGAPQNPAAPAVRPAWSRSHIDHDLGVGLTFPFAVQSTDFFNTGRGHTDLRHSDQREFTLLSPAVAVQIGPWGIGLNVDIQRYGLRRADTLGMGKREELMRAQFSSVRTTLARSVEDGQLVVGAGFVVAAMDVTSRDEVLTRNGAVFTTRGVAFEAGLLVRPNEQPFRVGLAARGPVATAVASGASDAARQLEHGGDAILGNGPADPNAIWLPSSVRSPWSADLGVAVQLGARPLNPRWVDPEELLVRVRQTLARRRQIREQCKAALLARLRAQGAGEQRLRELETEYERDQEWEDQAFEQRKARAREMLRYAYESMSRSYLLLAASLRVDGALAESVGIESFLQGVVDRSGERITFSPRVGAESEPIAHRLKLRAGGYVEPSRFRGGHARAHGTTGLDIKLASWSVFGLVSEPPQWKVGASLDIASTFYSWGISFGTWH